MGQILYKEKFPKTTFTAGNIIIAQPVIHRNEMLKRSVILITEHNSMGARGLILNKESNVLIDEVLSIPEQRIGKRVCYGGPEAMEVVSYVHHIQQIAEADDFGRGVFYGGNPQSIDELIRSNTMDFRKMKFIVGSVEWNSGQLEFEIANGLWWIDTITAGEIFMARPEDLWALKLCQQGHLMYHFAPSFEPSYS